MRNLNRPIVILFFTLFAVMVGFGVIIPVMPFYVLHFGATSLHLGLLMATFSVMQFLCAPYWGDLSDRIGRRPVLLIGLAGYVLSFLIMAYANALWMLFLSRIVGGVLSSATLPTALAYIGDTTSHEQRGAGMGILGAAMGLGVIFGPAIGGGLAGFGITAPFLFSAALAFVVLVVAIFVLPESLAPGLRAVTKAESGGRFGSLREALKGSLAPFYGLAFITSFGAANMESVFAFFAADKLGFGPPEMGFVFLVMGVVGVVLQGVAVGRLITRFGEERVLRAGLAIGAAGFVLITFSFNMLSLLLFVSVMSVGMGLQRPTISSLLSKRTSAGQGTTMGLQGSFDSLGRVIGPVWGGWLYQSGIALPYYSGAIIIMLGLLTMHLANRPRPAEQQAG